MATNSSSAATAAYDPNDTYVMQLYVLCSVFPALATVAVGLRFYSRWLKQVGLWWDDWTALLAMLFVWVDFVAVVQSIDHGKGKHIVFLSAYDKTMVRYWSYWFSIFYTAIPATIKVSALLLYRRIFISDHFNRLVTAMLVLVTCWGLSSVLLSVLGCMPVSAFWTSKGTCIDEHAWVLGFGVPNIVLDVAVWAMPIPRVWQLNLPRAQKISLTCIFAIGLTDCVLAIIRLAGSAESLGDSDTSYSWAPAMWWSVIHTCIGIIVISLPTMRILITRAGSRLSEIRASRMSAVTSAARSERPPRATSKYDAGFSLTGEDDHAVHSNAIAMLLKSKSETMSIPDSVIHVQHEFTFDDQGDGDSDSHMKAHSLDDDSIAIAK